MLSRISMITLGVKDVPSAARFYEIGLVFPKLDFESGCVAFLPSTGPG